MAHKQKQDEAQQAEDSPTNPFLVQSSKGQEAAGGRRATAPATVCSSQLASAWKIVNKIPLPVVMFLAGAVVGFVIGLNHRPTGETRCTPLPCVNTSLDLPTNGTTERGEASDSFNGTLPDTTSSPSPASEQNNTEAPSPSTQASDSFSGTLPGDTSSPSPADEQNNTEASPPQSTQPLTFEEYKKQQKERLRNLPRCTPRPAPVYLQEELSPLDGLRDRTLLTTVAVVDRCLCNVCRGYTFKRCSHTRHTNVTVFIEYLYEDNYRVAERQVRSDLACACQ